MKATLSSTYVQTLEHRLDVMAQFSLASDTTALQEIWPKTQRVLEDNGVDLRDICKPPTDEDELREFQQSVIASVRPHLSESTIQLFKDPNPYARVIFGKISLQRAREIYDASLLDETSGGMFITSAMLYHQLGKQFDVALEYFTLRTTASDELMWRMKMLFVIHGKLTEVLKLRSAEEPYKAHAFSMAVKNVISPHFESTLSGLLNRGIDGDVLRQEHAITMERIELAASAGLITSSTQERAARILRPPKVGFLGRLFGGKRIVTRS